MNEASKSAFLSYASQDAEAAHRICEALLMPIISGNNPTPTREGHGIANSGPDYGSPQSKSIGSERV